MKLLRFAFYASRTLALAGSARVTFRLPHHALISTEVNLAPDKSISHGSTGKVIWDNRPPVFYSHLILIVPTGGERRFLEPLSLKVLPNPPAELLRRLHLFGITPRPGSAVVGPVPFV